MLLLKHPCSSQIGRLLNLVHESIGISRSWHRRAHLTAQLQTQTYELLYGGVCCVHTLANGKWSLQLHVNDSSLNLDSNVILLSKWLFVERSFSNIEATRRWLWHKRGWTICYCRRTSIFSAEKVFGGAFAHTVQLKRVWLPKKTAATNTCCSASGPGCSIFHHGVC
jgi:hypothetical protein